MTKRIWTALQRCEPNPQYLAMLESIEDLSKKRIEVWANEHYQVTARIYPDGLVHLSCKREDRLPIHDWRQLQQMKNEIVGPDRWAVEVYPDETCIVDTSNEYHLWVLPPDADIPFAFMESEVRTAAEIETFNKQHRIMDRHGNDSPGKARQRPWQPGLTTAGGNTRDLLREVLDDAALVDDPNGYYGYLVSPGIIDKIKEALGGPTVL